MQTNRLVALRRAGATALLFSALTSRGLAQSPGTREIKADHHWLNVPISSTAPAHTIEIQSDGKTVRRFAAQLSPVNPEWWSSLDLGPWKGSTLQLHLADNATDPNLLASLEVSDDSKELGPGVYHEALRPQFHFTARRGYLNDINGPVFCNGQYHFFFQHSPFTWGGGAKHWGHAVSPDLVHWTQVAEALWPTDLGQMYSGSAVVDAANTSGLVGGSKVPLVLVYTKSDHGGAQCLASTKDGLTFDKFPGNPVIAPFPFSSRDPHAFWYEPGHHWVLVLYVGIPDPLRPNTEHDFYEQNAFRVFTSPNLRDWQQTDEIKGGIGHKDLFLAECPDLFPLPVPGQAGKVKWLLQGGTSEYYLGSFDGKKFTAESPRQRNRYGDVYAAQTFNNMPGGRIVQMIWLRAPTPGMPFNQCMSVPLDLSLKDTPKGLQLAYAPAGELKQLRGAPLNLPAGPLTEQDNPLAQVKGDGLDVEAEIKPGTAKGIVFDFRGTKVTYDVARQTLQVKKETVAMPLEAGVLRLRMLLDRTTLEVFSGTGTLYLPVGILPDAANQSHSLTAVGGTAEILSVKVYPMHSSWPS